MNGVIAAQIMYNIYITALVANRSRIVNSSDIIVRGSRA